MNSNYGWQKQQANERVTARLRDAQLYRAVKQDSPKNGWSFVHAAQRSVHWVTAVFHARSQYGSQAVPRVKTS